MSPTTRVRRAGVPTYQTLLTVLAIISGGIFFSEFQLMQPMPFFFFVVGVVVSLCGVALHSTHRAYLESQLKERGDASSPLPAPAPPGAGRGKKLTEAARLLP